MVILGTCSAIVYGLLGIPYALVLGLFTGLANIVPIVGPVASVILTAGVAATESWTKALGVIVFIRFTSRWRTHF
jgi:predicted PurR-regulated permease PerM